MNFLISNAHAQSSAPTADAFGFLLPMAAIFIVFYFLLIRPQQKRQKAHTALLQALSAGDEVTTTGGLLSKVTAVSEHYATLEISKGVQIKIQKSSVSAIVPRGTVDAA